MRQAYTIVGLSVPGQPQPAITGIVLENITVRQPGTLGECVWADVTATDLKPALPLCVNHRPLPPASCELTKTLGCYDDSKQKGLGFAYQEAVHDKTTFEVCAGACDQLAQQQQGSSTQQGNRKKTKFDVAAIDDGNHCYCGTASLLAALATSLVRPAAECEASHCHANASETGCGGKGRMVAYSYQNCKPAAGSV